MGISDWSNVITSVALIYLGWQQNQIFKRQNAIFAAQGGAMAMPTETARFLWLKRYWPTLIMIVLLLLTAFDIYDRHHGSGRLKLPPDFNGLEVIDCKAVGPYSGKQFINETVVIDGKEFLNCDFQNVKLLFHGTNTILLQHNTFHQGVMLATDNPAAFVFADLLSGFGMMRSEVSLDNQHGFFAATKEAPPQVPVMQGGK